MRRLAAVLVAVVLLGAGAACGRKSPGPDGARVSIAPGGAAHVVGAAGARLTGGDTGVLRPGDVLKVDRGRATLEFRDDVVIELAQGSELRAGGRPELIKGDALVVTKRTPGRLDAAGSTITVNGAGRVTNGLGVTAGSYRGKLAVESAGRSLTVPALRRTTVPGLGLVPSRPVPLTIDEKDPWDARYLGVAIAIGRDLKTFSTGFTRQVGDTDPSPLVAELVPDGSLLVGKAGRRAAGELLVGVSIAAAAPQGERASRVGKVFSFRDERAAWGLVVLDQALADPTRAVLLVDQAIKQWASRVTARLILGETARSFEAAGFGDDDAGAGAGGPSVAPSTPSSGTPSSPPPSSPPTTQPPRTDPGLPVPLPEPVEPILEPVGPVLASTPEAVQDAVDVVTGLVTTTATTLPKL